MKKINAMILAILMLFSCTVSFAVPAFAEGQKGAETVTVNGKTDDSGWLADGWTTVTSENGFWQSDKDGSFSYRYQMRTDERYLYCAVEMDFDFTDGGNGVGTNVRLWLNTNEDAYLYTHFYDVYFMSGSICVTAKHNTSLRENVGEETSPTGIFADADVKNKTIEFRVPLEEFGGTEEFAYYISVSNKLDANCCLYYPRVTPGDTSNYNMDLPYNAWSREKEAVVVPARIRLKTEPEKPADSDHPTEDQPEDKPGDPSDTEPTDPGKNENESGCRSVIGAGAGVLLVVVLLGGAALRKKD